MQEMEAFYQAAREEEEERKRAMAVELQRLKNYFSPTIDHVGLKANSSTGSDGKH
jgi:hypothetical protein